MAWQYIALRMLARGHPAFEPLDRPALLRVLDAISRDDVLAGRLDALDEAACEERFVMLYRAECDRPSEPSP